MARAGFFLGWNGEQQQRQGRRCTIPSQAKTERQPIATSTAANAAIMTSWPTLIPDMTTALASPMRCGKLRVTITLTGMREAMPLPIANTTP